MLGSRDRIRYRGQHSNLPSSSSGNYNVPGQISLGTRLRTYRQKLQQLVSVVRRLQIYGELRLKPCTSSQHPVVLLHWGHRLSHLTCAEADLTDLVSQLNGTEALQDDQSLQHWQQVLAHLRDYISEDETQPVLPMLSERYSEQFIMPPMLQIRRSSPSVKALSK
ncbi:MAG: hypothetical protein AAGF24_14080 [Cyanobacteria bacterium P01_H01_bin.121]